MTIRPRVSVLMTAFNTRPYLSEAIDSVLRQTLDDLELIVIDDCSTDDGWSVIVDAAARDCRIRPLRRERQGGASAGLNEGLGIAAGEYITRQDSDDVSLPTRLADQVTFLDAHDDIGAVGTAVTLIDPQGATLVKWDFPTSDADIQRTLLDQMCFCGPTLMVRKRILDLLDFRFDEALSGSEDYDLCLRAAEVTRLANLERALYLYRQHPSSVSRRREHEQLARKAAALEHALHRRCGDAPDPAIARTVARDYVTAAILAHFRGEPGASVPWVERAWSIHAPALDDPEWLAGVLRSCASSIPLSSALAGMRSLFLDVLPKRRWSWTLQRSLTAELHMSEVFAADPTDRTRIRQHLWSAIRSNPLWLANRGVLSLLLKDVLARRPAGSLT